jgi:hypothetical protein
LSKEQNMAALTGYRPTEIYGGAPDGVLPNRFYVPQGANGTIYGGALVVIATTSGGAGATAYTAGYAYPAGAASGLDSGYLAGAILGMADAGNAGGGLSSWVGTGVNGGNYLQVRQGCFLWDTSTAGGAITLANFGAKVYAVDDHTVALTGAPNTSCAGIFMGLNPSPTSLDPTQIQAAVLTIGVGAFGAIT